MPRAVLAALRAWPAVPALSSSGIRDADLPACNCELLVDGRPARLVGRECGGVCQLALLLCDEVRECMCRERDGVEGRCEDAVDAEDAEADESRKTGSGGRSGSMSKWSFKVGWWMGSWRSRRKRGWIGGCGEVREATPTLVSDEPLSAVVYEGFLDMEGSLEVLLAELCEC